MCLEHTYEHVRENLGRHASTNYNAYQRNLRVTKAIVLIKKNMVALKIGP